MRSRTLIREAQVVLPDGVQVTNVLIEGKRILDVGASRLTLADSVVEANGLALLPGVIDDQVHFREPGLTHKEDLTTASQACAAGGVTSFLEMPNTQPSAVTVQRVEEKYSRASEVSRVNYGFYIGATCDNLQELKAAKNFPGIKIFIGSSTGDLLVDDQQSLESIFAETTLPICAHCEDESTVKRNRANLGLPLRVTDHSKIRDHQAAIIATRRAIDLATRHRHRFHVLHVSTADEIPLLPSARPWVTAEVCPHHLFFSVEDYERLGTLIQMNPSIKTRADASALWRGLLDGDIQVIATDHAPHTLEEKSKPYPESPSGLPAVENSLALLLNQVATGRCRLEQVSHWMSDAPARIWGLVGKGRIQIGYDADLVLVDLNLKKTIRNEDQRTKSRWSPWDGVELTGWPVRTWVSGSCVYSNGKINDSVRGQRLVVDHTRGGYWATEGGIGLDQ